MSKDDTAVKDEAVQPDTAAPASAAEDTKPEVAEDALSDDAFDDVEASEQEEEAESQPESDDTDDDAQADTPDNQPQGEQKLAPKSENRFQKLANENRELKEQLDRLKLQETQIATEQELLSQINPETGDYYTPQEVQRIAFAQSREQQAQSIAQERFNLEVLQNQDVIRSEAERALTEFPMFDSNSSDYNPTLAAQADQLLGQSLIVENGVILGSTLSPYQLYKTIAESTQANQAQYEATAQKATEKMLANADVAGGASHATKPKDTDLEDFEAGWNS